MQHPLHGCGSGPGFWCRSQSSHLQRQDGWSKPRGYCLLNLIRSRGGVSSWKGFRVGSSAGGNKWANISSEHKEPKRIGNIDWNAFAQYCLLKACHTNWLHLFPMAVLLYYVKWACTVLEYSYAEGQKPIGMMYIKMIKLKTIKDKRRWTKSQAPGVQIGTESCEISPNTVHHKGSCPFLTHLFNIRPLL